MKIRSGFVSNSSSSSFVVRARKEVLKPCKDDPRCQRFDRWESVLTPAQVNLLKKFGFRKTWAHSPGQVPSTREEFDKQEQWLKKNPKSDYTWGYDITCNQDEVFKFLLDNKISFSAEEHYGHRHVFYDSKTDKVTVAINFGVIMSMYGVEEKMDVSNPIQTFTRGQYLKRVTW